MKDIDYIKEKLNTLRVEFMAKIFIAIALGSGLSKIILDTTEKINDNQQFMFNFGMSILLIISLLLVFDVIQLKKYTNKLKD